MIKEKPVVLLVFLFKIYIRCFLDFFGGCLVVFVLWLYEGDVFFLMFWVEFSSIGLNKYILMCL